MTAHSGVTADLLDMQYSQPVAALSQWKVLAKPSKSLLQSHDDTQLATWLEEAVETWHSPNLLKQMLAMVATLHELNAHLASHVQLGFCIKLHLLGPHHQLAAHSACNLQHTHTHTGTPRTGSAATALNLAAAVYLQTLMLCSCCKSGCSLDGFGWGA